VHKNPNIWHQIQGSGKVEAVLELDVSLRQLDEEPELERVAPVHNRLLAGQVEGALKCIQEPIMRSQSYDRELQCQRCKNYNLQLLAWRAFRKKIVLL
jgi:hypothetical protein